MEIWPSKKKNCVRSEFDSDSDLPSPTVPKNNSTGTVLISDLVHELMEGTVPYQTYRKKHVAQQSDVHCKAVGTVRYVEHGTDTYGMV